MNEQNNNNYGYYGYNRQNGAYNPYAVQQAYAQQAQAQAPQTPQTEELPKKGMSLTKKIVVTALCCSLLGSAVGAGGMLAGMKLMNSDKGTQASQSVQAGTTDSKSGETQIVTGSRKKSESNNSVATTTADTSKLMSASELYNKYVNSTVGIKTSITTNYFGYTTQSAASGSGFIISKDGYIVTNYHVIEGADSVKVSCYDGSEYDAEIVGTDQSNDIAVLKIEATGLEPVVLGSSSDLSIGDNVVAIGNPLGELTFSLTSGVVSALDRTITTEKNTTMNLIQTDCSINSGNSGGALFNMYGEVVGITNAKYSSNGISEASIDNIAFAIPIDNVRSIINSIIENGYVMKPYIGVSLKDVSADSQAAGIPKGAQVEIVNEGQPAEKAGIQVGDVITALNGEAMESSKDLVAAIKNFKSGDEITLTVYRKGETLEIPVTVSEKKQDDTANQQAQAQQQQQQQQQYEQFEFPFGGMFGY